MARWPDNAAGTGRACRRGEHGPGRVLRLRAAAVRGTGAAEPAPFRSSRSKIVGTGQPRVDEVGGRPRPGPPCRGMPSGRPHSDTAVARRPGDVSLLTEALDDLAEGDGDHLVTGRIGVDVRPDG